MLIAASALLVYAAGDYPRVALAEPASAIPSAADGGEKRAEELYLDALEKLAAGHRDFARETFESVIAQYPGTKAAADARRELGTSAEPGASTESAGDGKLGEASQTMPDIIGPVTGSLPVLSDAVDGPDTAAPAPSWDRELRRNASIQSKMRIEAGDRVFFAPGSAELGTRARSALSAQAQWLMRWHDLDAAIEGHADEPGTEEENVVLSQQRAEAVRQRLIDEGIEPSRLAAVPLGRSLRIATCADTECRAQNRRAVTLVFATGTRERLGLVGASGLSAAMGKPVPAVAITPAGATATQAVGVTR